MILSDAVGRTDHSKESPSYMPKLERLWDSLYHWAEHHSDRVAIRHGSRLLTFAQLVNEAECRAQWLMNLGVTAGDRVIVVGYNSIDWVVAYLGIMRLGAIAALVNNRISPKQMTDSASLLGAKLALADIKHQYMFGIADVQLDMLEAWERPLRMSLPPLPAADDPAVISFTSGTTGLPKGAILSARAIFEASATYQRFLNTGPDDNTIVLSPLFHNTGFIDQLGQMLIVGGETVLVTEFHRKDAIEAFRQSPSTFVTAVPSVLRMLMLMDESDVVFGPARLVVFGGSPMPQAWSRELSDRWPHLKLVHGYGLTEFGSACTFLPPTLIHDHGASVGFPAPGVKMRLMDDEERDVSAGEVGEIWVAGPTRMLGYWRRPGETARKIRGEWLRTGDLGKMDDEGRLYLSGRVDDIINRGGEKILPSHVECLLSDCRGVANCTVVGIPDPVLQQVPVAVVEHRKDQEFNRSEAVAYLTANLPGYAVPRSYVIVDCLPRMASGKIDRAAALALAVARCGQ